MTFANHGNKGWHYDHIRPIASFNLLDEEEQKVCFHYTNFQPLWAEDNLNKSSFYEGVKYKYNNSREKKIQKNKENNLEIVK